LANVIAEDHQNIWFLRLRLGPFAWRHSYKQAQRCNACQGLPLHQSDVASPVI
jgi:hypothetical protein